MVQNNKDKKEKKKINLKEETGKIKGFYDDFKNFISKGNVVDLAVAVVIGNSFNKIISSLVNDIIMPLVGVIIGGIDFTNIKLTIGSESILIGSFIQNIIDFLIIAFSIFVVIKLMSKFQRKKEEIKEEPTKKADDVILLEEIRDLLKNK
ncbi:MAG: large conductance mechanosensitive channel protein MscL [Bacilli bacterium]|nr:large conductance mechanosensitive channel protein MscL [Bacilli bacterium]